nr:hypothetical protein Cduv_327 [Cedratvirus duvanny]
MQPEILVAIIKEMQLRDILRMSLVLPELFDKGIWMMLCTKRLSATWDDYYFLFPDNPRKRFIEIAQRKCFLRTTSPFRQIHFAILNKRKDILEECCKQDPDVAKSILVLFSSRVCIYFNLSMHRFIYRCLSEEPRERKNIIDDLQGEFSVSKEIKRVSSMQIFREDGECNLLQRFTYTIDYEKNVMSIPYGIYPKLYDRLHMHVLYGADDEDVVFDKDNIEFWLVLYSKSQKKEIIQSLIEQATEQDLRMDKNYILYNLYASNNIEMAAKFEEKFNIKLSDNQTVTNLALYYFNTGDSKGLYESLINLETRGMIEPGTIKDKLIFEFDLPEVNTILKRCSVWNTNQRCCLF